MVFMTISMVLVSIIKGTGAFLSLMCAHTVFQMALAHGGWYVILYVVALYLVWLSGLCLYDSAVECVAIIDNFFDEEDDIADS